MRTLKEAMVWMRITLKTKIMTNFQSNTTKIKLSIIIKTRRRNKNRKRRLRTMTGIITTILGTQGLYIETLEVVLNNCSEVSNTLI
jgi:hypothetical protein